MDGSSLALQAASSDTSTSTTATIQASDAIVPRLLQRPASELGIVVSVLAFPRQLIKRRLITTSAVAVFCHVEFLMLVILHADTVLTAPALSFSEEAMRFHQGRIYSLCPDSTPHRVSCAVIGSSKVVLISIGT